MIFCDLLKATTNGAPADDRTRNLWDRSPTLYPMHSPLHTCMYDSKNVMFLLCLWDCRSDNANRNVSCRPCRLISLIPSGQAPSPWCGIVSLTILILISCYSNVSVVSVGPIAVTTNAFWKMIYQENVSVVVMLTEIEERGVSGNNYPAPNNTKQAYFSHIMQVKNINSTIVY